MMSMEQAVLAGKRPNLELRCQVMQIVRDFFFEAGFLEVQTPVLTPAPAPELHIDAVPCTDGFLSTSPELYMKRLLAAGYGKIFQLAPAFRAGERGRLHHPEFMLLEWYRLEADYEALQADCIELLRVICHRLGKGDGFHSQGTWLETRGPWPRVKVRDAFRELAGWEPGAYPDVDRFNMDLVEKVEPNLGSPTPAFLVDYPASQAALARLKTDDPTVAERFELYWAGIELANGFSELIDVTEQRRRFHETNENRRLAGRIVYPVAEAFLQSLQHLQPSAGIALGVDRLVLILVDAADLEEVVAFPPEML
jgi:elongation factor P--(R)-beta-lysine ligase